ncbi:cupin domain-containing protein [bacterium]|nr:cupin domain-containing protein [bacterium]
MKAISTKTAEHYQWGDHCDGYHLVKSDKLSVIEEIVPAGASEKNHYHDQATQFFYILNGTGTLKINDDIVQLSAGEGIVIEPGTPHQFRNDSDRDVRFLVVSTPKSHGDRHEVSS